MAGKVDIQTFDYEVFGEKVYTAKVVNKETGVVEKSMYSQDPNEANDFVNDALRNNPDATVDGETPPPPGTTPSSGAVKVSPPPPSPPPQVEAESDTSEIKSADADLPTASPYNPRNEKFTANSKKKAVDCSGLPDAQRYICELDVSEKFKRGVSGIFGQKRIQAKINRIDCESEWVRRGPDNNAFIVIGNDRTDGKMSGYGGKGYTQCDSIDLVAGMGGFKPNQADGDGVLFHTSPNLFLDSARVHISQKTDVDKNFGIGLEESMQIMSVAKSAVTVKADNVRLVGRESIVFVTNTDAFNSQGGQINQWSGIHLMANNDEEALQPIPVGNNLAQCIHELSKHLEGLAKMFHGYLKYQMKFNQAVSKHTHLSPFYAKPTLPSQSCQASGMLVDIEHLSKTELGILKHLTNLAGFRNNYLTTKGKQYINSRFNKTN